MRTSRFFVMMFACLGVLAGLGSAQTVNTIYSFSGGTDGAYPSARTGGTGRDGLLYGLVEQVISARCSESQWLALKLCCTTSMGRTAQVR